MSQERSKRPMPKYTEQVFQVFLENNRALRKSDVVALLAKRGVKLKTSSVKRPFEWLFDYRYIGCIGGPTGGPYPIYKYALNPNHPKWPPANVRSKKYLFERLPIKGPPGAGSLALRPTVVFPETGFPFTLPIGTSGPCIGEGQLGVGEEKMTPPDPTAGVPSWLSSASWVARSGDRATTGGGPL